MIYISNSDRHVFIALADHLNQKKEKDRREGKR